LSSSSDLIFALELGPADAAVLDLGADQGYALGHAVDDLFVFSYGVDAVLIGPFCRRGRVGVGEGGGGAFRKGLELVVRVLEVGDGVADLEDFEVQGVDGEVFYGGGEAGGGYGGCVGGGGHCC